MILATGYVYGKYWGGGESAYKALNLSFETREELVKHLSELKSFNELDSGLGYQEVIGGIYAVQEIKYVDDWTMTRQLDEVTFGNLSDEQFDFVYDLI
jgi:hypothetical protein